MHRFTRIVICAVLTFGVVTAAFAAPTQMRRMFNAAQKIDLKRVSDYLNSVHTLKGSFVQVNPDGSLWEGMMYLSKPGKMRFEYKPPSPHLIVADGSTLTVEDRKLKTVDRFPLIGSPLALLLSDDIDLTTYSHITSVKHQPGMLLVSASAASGGTHGDIVITFSDPGLELRQWEIVDSEGYKTTVVLNDLQIGVALSPDLFVMRASATPRKSQN